MEALNISSFIKEGENYTKDVFPDIDLKKILDSVINGQIDNKGMLNIILSLFGDELISAISLLGSILIIVIIHSILKSFSDNLNNSEIGQIAYYVEYILIVTLIMSNFSNIINMIREAISNLVGFVNCLVPILLALMSATRKCCVCFSSSALDSFFNSIYRKYNNFIYITYNINCYSY